MFRKLGFVAIIGTLVSLTGCFEFGGVNATAQKALTDYISKTFAVTNIGEKAKLVELTTGEVKHALSMFSDLEFQRQFIDSKKEFISLKIRDERRMADGREAITYELTYLSTSAESKDRVTNKKQALLVNENGRWLIGEVRNLKTYIEHQNEMSF